MPDFTIITANRNYARFLPQCLQSVADQKGVTVEHWVMDGESDDESADVVRRFPHAKWHCESDNGMSEAINRGFDRATGDWVMWLNADDFLLPGALAEMARFLKMTDADVVYGNYCFVDASGSLLRRLKVPRWSLFVHVHHECYVPSTAAVYRRASVLEQGYRLRQDFHYVMDGEWYARLDRDGKKFAHMPVEMACFRLHGNNASMRYLGRKSNMSAILSAERQHIESRAIRRAYGITCFSDPYLNGWIDGFLWLIAKGWKWCLRRMTK